MISVVVYALVAIGLAAAAGYAVMMFFDASQTTSLVQENQARLDTAVTVARANLRAVNQDGVLFPPQGEVPSGEDMLGLPAWFSVLRSSPWNAAFNYCPLGPAGTYNAGGTVARVPTGDAPDILGVTTGAGGVFEVSGDRRLQFPGGRTVQVIGSTGNNGDYVVSSSSWSPLPVDRTLVVMTGNVPSATPDGRIQVYYNVNTATSGGQTYVVADDLDIAGIAATEEAGLLGIIISAPPRSAKVPPCHNVIYQNGAFRVDGGTVRAITSGVAEAQQDFAAAGKVTKTVNSSADLETALNEWVSVKPRIMEIDLASGSYSIEANPGGPFAQAMADSDEKLLVLKGVGGVATITVTDSDANLTSGLLIPSRFQVENIALVADVSLAANAWLDVRERDFILKTASVPSVRLTGADMTVEGASGITATTDGGLSIIGGTVQVRNAASLAVSSNVGSAVTISGGLLQVLSGGSVTATSTGGTLSGGLNLVEGDVQVQGGATLTASSATGPGVLVSGGELQVLGGGTLTASSTFATGNAMQIDSGSVLLGSGPTGAALSATVPTDATAILMNAGEFLATGTAGTSPSTITLARSAGTLALGINLGGNMILKGTQVLFPDGATQGIFLDKGAMFTLDNGSTIGAADPSTTQRPTTAIYDNGGAGIYGATGTPTVRVPSGGRCWMGLEDATGALLDTSSTCRQTAATCGDLGGNVNACSKHLFVYSQGGVTAGQTNAQSSAVRAPPYNNTPSTGRTVCSQGWTFVALTNRSAWTCEVN